MVDFLPGGDRWGRGGSDKDRYVRRFVPAVRKSGGTSRGRRRKPRTASQIEPSHSGLGPRYLRPSGGTPFHIPVMNIRPYKAFWLAFAIVLGGRLGWVVTIWIGQFARWMIDQPY